MLGYCVSRPDDYYFKCIEDAPVADTTKKCYGTSIKRILNIIPNKRLCDIITEPEDSYEVLAAAITLPSSLRSTTSTILAVLKHANIKLTYPILFERWNKLAAPLIMADKKQQLSNIPTAKQELARLEWDDIENTLNTLGRKDYGSRVHVLLAMYTLIPPRRHEDYFQVYIYQSPTDTTPKENHHAYIDLTLHKPIVHVKDYKTVASLKPWTKELPSQLVAIIRKSIELNPRQYLITRKNGESYTLVNSYTQATDRTLKKIFGQHANLNSIRHAYSTKISRETISVWDHKQIARDMGHSIVTNMSYAYHNAPKKPSANE